MRLGAHACRPVCLRAMQSGMAWHGWYSMVWYGMACLTSRGPANKADCTCVWTLFLCRADVLSSFVPQGAVVLPAEMLSSPVPQAKAQSGPARRGPVLV